MSEYRCFCKSAKGREMARYDGNPKRAWAMTNKAPFAYGEWGRWCRTCGKVGLRKSEQSNGKSVVLFDMLNEGVEA